MLQDKQSMVRDKRQVCVCGTSMRMRARILQRHATIHGKQASVKQASALGPQHKLVGASKNLLDLAQTHTLCQAHAQHKVCAAHEPSTKYASSVGQPKAQLMRMPHAYASCVCLMRMPHAQAPTKVSYDAQLMRLHTHTHTHSHTHTHTHYV